MNTNELQQLKSNSEILISQKTIEETLDILARKIEQDYQDKTPVFIVVLNGGLIFAGQLLPKIDLLCEIDYCHATRYQGDTRGAELVWKAKPQTSLKNRHVILVDDILDEGITLQLIADYCESQGASSVKTLVLVEKEHHRKVYPNQKPDYCELTVPDKYVFGFGMDYAHHWRNTRNILVLSDDQ